MYCADIPSLWQNKFWLGRWNWRKEKVGHRRH